MNYDEKIQELRIEWKNNPEKRKIIELQVRALKLGKNVRGIDVESLKPNNQIQADFKEAFS